MVNHSTVGHKINPARPRKRSRRRRKKTSRTRERCVTITLKDVGDIDDRELNTIPSCVEGEITAWEEEKSKRNMNSSSTSTDPLLNIHSGHFRPLCVQKLIFPLDSGSTADTCDRGEPQDDMRKEQVAQEILNVLRHAAQSRLDEPNCLTGLQDQNSDATPADMVENNLLTVSNIEKSKSVRGLSCSLSRVSIQVMCTSESTLSNGTTRDVSPSVPRSESDRQKLETVAGALLLELCKVTAEKITANEKKMMLTTDSYMPRLKKMRRGRPDAEHKTLEARLPNWLRELCSEEYTKRTKRGILKQTRSQIVASKFNIFRPMLCTKLSFPWVMTNHSQRRITCKRQQELEVLRDKSSSILKMHKTQHRRNKEKRKDDFDGKSKENVKYLQCHSSDCSDLPKNISLQVFTSKITNEDRKNNRESREDSSEKYETYKVGHSTRKRRELRGDESTVCQGECQGEVANGFKRTKRRKRPRREDTTEGQEESEERVTNQLKRSKGGILLKESTEDRVDSHDGPNDGMNEKRIKDVCPKCQSSIQCSIALRTAAPKPPKIKNRTSNPQHFPFRKSVKKTKLTTRPDKSHRQQTAAPCEISKNRQTFGVGDPTTKHYIKSFFIGTTSTSETTKAPMKAAKKPGRKKKPFVPPRISGKVFNQQAKKMRPSPARRSSVRPVENGAKRSSKSDIEASEEMDIINNHIRSHSNASDSSPVFHTCFRRLVDKELKARSGRSSKDSQAHKMSRGGYFFGRHPVEIKKFNDGIFSCLIPKVFK